MIARINDECFFRDAQLTPQDPRRYRRGYIRTTDDGRQTTDDGQQITELAQKVGRQICAGLCSAIIPGAGQFYLGHAFYGCFFLSLAIAAWVWLPIGIVVLIHVGAALHALFTLA